MGEPARRRGDLSDKAPKLASHFKKKRKKSESYFRAAAMSGSPDGTWVALDLCKCVTNKAWQKLGAGFDDSGAVGD